LPYVYALRGDRDWRRSPQLTGSRQVSQLAVQAYKLLEAGDATIPQLKHALGREVSESAVLRAITELWQQLRIIPVVSGPNKPPQWQLLRTRYQKAIAEGASTSQVTAISVLASIYLQAVIAASMEEVEMFLAPLTARSKVREVLRGLVATRQVHSLALGHAPHFYVAGTLPEFAAQPTMYASSSMPASSHFLRSYEHEESARFSTASRPVPHFASAPAPAPKPVEPEIERPSQTQQPQARETASAARPRFSHQPATARDRKPAKKSTTGRITRRPTRDARSSAPRANSSSRHAQVSRWAKSTPANGRSNGNGNGHSNGNGHAKRHASNGHSTNGKATAKPARRADASRKSARPDARGSRKPALTASTKAGNRSRYGFTASSNRRSKKRG
jgi:hypothetical protein